MHDENRELIVKEARTWLGTPYKHQGRLKGQACDCLGLIVGVAKELNLIKYVFREYADIEHINRNYSSMPDGVTLEANCNKLLNRLELDPIITEVLPFGSIALMFMSNRNYPQHMGILTNLPGRMGLIHSHQKLGSVREHVYDSIWRRRTVALYDFKVN